MPTSVDIAIAPSNTAATPAYTTAICPFENPNIGFGTDSLLRLGRFGRFPAQRSCARADAFDSPRLRQSLCLKRHKSGETADDTHSMCQQNKL
jgi:hypothetical protein